MPDKPEKPSPETKSVFVALVGRPNVGKSSLLNRLVGEEVAIVTPRQQTTRNCITGLLTDKETQYVLFDTPGIHTPHNKLDERMSKATIACLRQADVAVMMFEPQGDLNAAEKEILDVLPKAGHAVAAINKVDKLRRFSVLEERRQFVASLGVFDQVICLSALDGTGSEALLSVLKRYGHPGPHYYDPELFTSMTEKEMVAELVREEALLLLRDEIPHGIAVSVTKFKPREDKNQVDIDVEIICERKSHKGIIIGKDGKMLKKIASSARLAMEKLLDCKVHLTCWVKVRDGWRNSNRLLDSLGFSEP